MVAPYPTSPYPRGENALKAHLRSGVGQDEFDDMSLSDLCQWLSMLLSENGYLVHSLPEVVVRAHISRVDAGGVMYARPCSVKRTVDALFHFGVPVHQLKPCSELVIEKLLRANLLEVVMIPTYFGKRKKWKKDIPGLSRKNITYTIIHNPHNMSFDDFLKHVRTLG
jgi:hypothetical protein